ncbi:hypothetical protein HDU82_008946, partial [Entophlyctis luteolus]
PRIYKSYDTTLENAKAALAKDGVAVVPGVLPQDVCGNLRMRILSDVETLTQGRFKHSDPTTWHVLNDDLKLINNMLVHTFSLGHLQPVWDIRQDPRVVRVFAELWNLPPEDLITSFDGWSIILCNGERYPHRDTVPLHLDQSGTVPGLDAYQGFITLFDVEEGDAALTVYEGSHRLFAQYCTEHDPSGFFLKHPEFYKQRCMQTHVLARAGSLVLWDSRTAHKGALPVQGVAPRNARLVVYVCMTPRARADASALSARVSAFGRLQTTNHRPHAPRAFPTLPGGAKSRLHEFTLVGPPALTPLGRRLVGLPDDAEDDAGRAMEPLVASLFAPLLLERTPPVPPELPPRLARFVGACIRTFAADIRGCLRVNSEHAGTRESRRFAKAQSVPKSSAAQPNRINGMEKMYLRSHAVRQMDIFLVCTWDPSGYHQACESCGWAIARSCLKAGLVECDVFGFQVPVKPAEVYTHVVGSASDFQRVYKSLMQPAPLRNVSSSVTDALARPAECEIPANNMLAMDAILKCVNGNGGIVLSSSDDANDLAKLVAELNRTTRSKHVLVCAKAAPDDFLHIVDTVLKQSSLTPANLVLGTDLPTAMSFMHQGHMVFAIEFRIKTIVESLCKLSNKLSNMLQLSRSSELEEASAEFLGKLEELGMDARHVVWQEETNLSVLVEAVAICHRVSQGRLLADFEISAFSERVAICVGSECKGKFAFAVAEYIVATTKICFCEAGSANSVLIGRQEFDVIVMSSAHKATSAEACCLLKSGLRSLVLVGERFHQSYYTSLYQTLTEAGHAIHHFRPPVERSPNRGSVAAVRYPPAHAWRIIVPQSVLDEIVEHGEEFGEPLDDLRAGRFSYSILPFSGGGDRAGCNFYSCHVHGARQMLWTIEIDQSEQVRLKEKRDLVKKESLRQVISILAVSTSKDVAGHWETFRRAFRTVSHRYSEAVTTVDWVNSEAVPRAGFEEIHGVEKTALLKFACSNVKAYDISDALSYLGRPASRFNRICLPYRLDCFQEEASLVDSAVIVGGGGTGKTSVLARKLHKINQYVLHSGATSSRQLFTTHSKLLVQRVQTEYLAQVATYSSIQRDLLSSDVSKRQRPMFLTFMEILQLLDAKLAGFRLNVNKCVQYMDWWSLKEELGCTGIVFSDTSEFAVNCNCGQNWCFESLPDLKSFTQGEFITGHVRFCKGVNRLLLRKIFSASSPCNVPLFETDDDRTQQDKYSLLSQTGRESVLRRVSVKHDLVDRDRFKNMYYCKLPMKLQRKYSAALVYSEIMSNIKSVSQSGKLTVLNCKEYEDKISRKIDLNDRATIWNFCRTYNEEKTRREQVDILDIMANILSRLSFASGLSVQDYFEDFVQDVIFVDEVQDFFPCQLSLFQYLKHKETKLICAGDQAQAISPGSNFKFAYLKCSLYEKYKEKPTVVQLRINYRSTPEVVTFCERILELLRTCLPEEMDFFVPLEVPRFPSVFGKPKMFSELGEKALLFLFKKMEKFSSEQMIIAKTERDKTLLKTLLEKMEARRGSFRLNATVLTALDTKGLEFDDVILFNFFQTESKNFQILSPNALKQPDMCQGFQPLELDFVGRELKELYVAATRARKRLFFIDMCAGCRDFFRNVFGTSIDTTSVADEPALTMNTDSRLWNARGFDFQSIGLLDEAIRSFVEAGNQEMVKRVEIQKLMKDYDATCIQSRKLVKLAAKLYIELGEKRDAADILFRAQFFADAADIYDELNFGTRVIRCCAEGNMHERLFQALNKYASSVEREIRDAQYQKLITVYFPDSLDKVWECGKRISNAEFRNGVFVRLVERSLPGETNDDFENLMKYMEEISDCNIRDNLLVKFGYNCFPHQINWVKKCTQRIFSKQTRLKHLENIFIKAERLAMGSNLPVCCNGKLEAYSSRENKSDPSGGTNFVFAQSELVEWFIKEKDAERGIKFFILSRPDKPLIQLALSVINAVPSEWERVIKSQVYRINTQSQKQSDSIFTNVFRCEKNPKLKLLAASRIYSNFVHFSLLEDLYKSGNLQAWELFEWYENRDKVESLKRGMRFFASAEHGSLNLSLVCQLAKRHEQLLEIVSDDTPFVYGDMKLSEEAQNFFLSQAKLAGPEMRRFYLSRISSSEAVLSFIEKEMLEGSLDKQLCDAVYFYTRFKQFERGFNFLQSLPFGGCYEKRDIFCNKLIEDSDGFCLKLKGAPFKQFLVHQAEFNKSIHSRFHCIDQVATFDFENAFTLVDRQEVSSERLFYLATSLKSSYCAEFVKDLCMGSEELAEIGLNYLITRDSEPWMTESCLVKYQLWNPIAEELSKHMTELDVENFARDIQDIFARILELYPDDKEKLSDCIRQWNSNEFALQRSAVSHVFRDIVLNIIDSVCERSTKDHSAVFDLASKCFMNVGKTHGTVVNELCKLERKRPTLICSIIEDGLCCYGSVCWMNDLPERLNILLITATELKRRKNHFYENMVLDAILVEPHVNRIFDAPMSQMRLRNVFYQRSITVKWLLWSKIVEEVMPLCSIPRIFEITKKSYIGMVEKCLSAITGKFPNDAKEVRSYFVEWLDDSLFPVCNTAAAEASRSTVLYILSECFRLFPMTRMVCDLAFQLVSSCVVYKKQPYHFVVERLQMAPEVKVNIFSKVLEHAFLYGSGEFETKNVLRAIKETGFEKKCGGSCELMKVISDMIEKSTN